MPLNDNRDSSMERLTPTLNELTRVLGELSDVVGDLQGIGKDFTKDVGKSASALKDTSKAFEKENSTLDKTLQKHGAKFDGYAKAAVQSLSAVLSFALNKFEKGFNSIVENFNQNFTAITSRQQYTQRQYASMLNGFTKWVETHDLRTQFSQIDLSNALIPVLQTGIRGGLAEEMAKRNVVTEKLLPMINTNTRAYMRMSKLFGDTFTQGITAIGTYTERYLQSAEGLEEGNLDSVIQTIYRELGEVAKTPEQFNKMMQETIASYQIMASKYGADYAGTALQNYSKWISGEGVMSGDLASILPGKSASNRSFDAFGKAMETIFSTYIDGRMPSGYGANAFGFSKEAIQDYMIGQKFNKEMTVSMDEVLADFDASAEYQKDMYTLSQGAYNSITEQQNKFNENAMAYLGTLAAENIPDVQGSLNLIKGIVSAFFTAWLTSRASDSIRGGLRGAGGEGSGGLLSRGATKVNASLGGGQTYLKGYKADTVGGRAAQFIHGGTGENVTLAASPNFATIGLGLAEIAGGAYGAYYGASKGIYGGIQDINDKTLTNGKGVGAAKIAGGAAAIGGGATLAGVGAATALAGAAGASAAVPVVGWIATGVLAAGAATIMIAENTKHVNDFAKSVDRLRDPMKESIQNYTEGIQDQLYSIKQLTDEQDKLTAIAQLFNLDPQDSFISKLPTTTEALNEFTQALITGQEAVSNQGQEYVDNLIDSMESEYANVFDDQKLVDMTLDKFFGDTNKLKKGSAEANQFRNFVYEMAEYMAPEQGEAAKKAVDAALSGKGTFNVKGISRDEAEAILGKKGQGQGTAFFSGAVDLKNAVFGKGNIVDFSGMSKMASKYFGGDVSFLDEEKFNEAEALKATGDAIGLLYGYAERYKNSADTLMKEAWYNSYKSVWDSRNLDAYAQYNVIGKHKPGDAFTGDASKDVPGFRMGAFNIFRDGLLSILHAGEMVLPASAAEDLRELSGSSSISGVASFLKSLLGLSKATPTASALPDTSTVDTLTSAIEAQTQALSKILNSILDKVSNIDGMMDGQLRRNLNQGNVPEMVRSWFGFPLTEN